jgi:hypothetical protein
MMLKILIRLPKLVPFPAVLLPLAVLLLAASVQAAEPLDVRVKNFPETQRITGSVFVDGVVSHGRSKKFEGLVVQSSRRSELGEVVYAGSVETEGFTSLSISLQGEVKSSNFSAGSVGVLLIPDEEPILRIFREGKQVQFPLEAEVPLKPGNSEYFSGQQDRQRIAFPRYRVYLYNTLNRTVEANVYLYLAN